MKLFPANLWAPILALLILADIGWRFWVWTHPHAICGTTTSITGKPFMLMADHRSNLDVISIRKREVWEPVWAEWDFDHDGKVDEASYFFRGRDVFNVNLKEGQPPKFDVYFYGPGRSVTWWLDRGGAGSFTDRIFYDTNGIQTRHEVLYGQTWRVVETRDRKKGMVMGGQWIPLQLTNGGWTPDQPLPNVP